MKNPEFSPRDALERAFRRWWVIVLVTVLGGFAGWAFHFFNPPVYEATSVITVNMDFQKRQLTQYEEDFAFGAAGAIGTSDEVENQIIAQAKRIGIPIELNQLQLQMFLEQKQSVWELHIRNRNPENAAKLANLWAQNFYSALNAALAHAIHADQIQSEIDAITGAASPSGSSVISPKDQTALTSLSNELLLEQQSSQGIISIMKFSQTGSAIAPKSPVLYRLAILVLAGAGIGFVVSIWLASSYKLQRHE
jgi:capsular polysaccharide biosynthesis protein